jgi:hypothetical protein
MIHASKDPEAEISTEILIKALPISPIKYSIICVVDGAWRAATSSWLNSPKGNIDIRVTALKVVNRPNTVAIPTVSLVLACAENVEAHSTPTKDHNVSSIVFSIC